LQSPAVTHIHHPGSTLFYNAPGKDPGGRIQNTVESTLIHRENGKTDVRAAITDTMSPHTGKNDPTSGKKSLRAQDFTIGGSI